MHMGATGDQAAASARKTSTLRNPSTGPTPIRPPCNFHMLPM